MNETSNNEALLRDVPGEGLVAGIRDAFIEADFTMGGVAELIGPVASSALGRDHTVAARRALGEDAAPLSLLTRLFILGDHIGADVADQAALPWDAMAEAGLIHRDGSDVVPTLNVAPYGDPEGEPWWLVSDFLDAHPLRDDHVLGLGGAATSLAQLTVPLKVESALDLGTGCGIQLLHLAQRASSVLGTDTNERALALSRLTLALSGVQAELAQGDRFEPVTGRRFDLIVTNPPVVVGPTARFEYRDSGLDGDGMSRDIATHISEHLNDDGWGQQLANWLYVRGEDWRERVASWLPTTGVDAWVVQREVLDPARYVEMWLHDGGDVGTDEYRRLYDEWLQWFDDRDVEGVGMGWITQHVSGSDQPVIRLENLRQHVDQPVGPWVVDRFAASDWLRDTTDEALLDAVLGAQPGLQLQQSVSEEFGGWRAEKPLLVQRAGLHRTAPTDDFGAAVVAACDGATPLGSVLSAVATALGYDPAGVREGAGGAVRALVDDGFLIPTDVHPRLTATQG